MKDRTHTSHIHINIISNMILFHVGILNVYNFQNARSDCSFHSIPKPNALHWTSKGTCGGSKRTWAFRVPPWYHVNIPTFIIHDASCIMHHTSCIMHLSCIVHDSWFMIHHAFMHLCIMYHACIVHHTSYIIHRPSFMSYQREQCMIDSNPAESIQ